MVLRRLFGSAKQERKEGDAKFATCAYAVPTREPKCTNMEVMRALSSRKTYPIASGSDMIELPGVNYCIDCKFYQKKA